MSITQQLGLVVLALDGPPGELVERELTMALGLSLVLIAAGLIMVVGIEYSVSGIDITAIGFVLLGVGILGMLLSVLLLESWALLRSSEHHHDTP
jgi:hypothetical protein